MRRRMFLCGALATLAAPAAMAEEGAPAPVVIEDFSGHPETRWKFYTDAVMGGVSTGELMMLRGPGAPRAHMTGHISTENHGGFIQMRLALPKRPPPGARGLWLEVRGNGETYFAHLHTRAMFLPWQYYQAGFTAPKSWRRIELPFSAFHPSGRMLRATPRPEDLISLAVVAFGHDYEADVEVRAIGFY